MPKYQYTELKAETSFHLALPTSQDIKTVLVTSSSGVVDPWMDVLPTNMLHSPFSELRTARAKHRRHEAHDCIHGIPVRLAAIMASTFVFAHVTLGAYAATPTVVSPDPTVPKISLPCVKIQVVFWSCLPVTP